MRRLLDCAMMQSVECYYNQSESKLIAIGPTPATRAGLTSSNKKIFKALRDYTANYRNGLICVLFFLANHLVLHSDFTNCWAVLGWS